jgi:hypothetical protein
MTDEIFKRIDALAAKLGVTASQIWAVLVKQARIEAVEDICWALFWFLLAGLLSRMAWHAHKKDEESSGEVIVFGVITAVVCIGVGMAFIAGTPGMILNPQYWALKRLAEAFGK